MPPHPSEWLAEIGVARFGADATEFLLRYRAWSAERSLVTERPDFAQDYIELGAVEFALGPRIVSAALELQPVISLALPVDILPTHLGLAALKTNCGPFGEHGLKAPDELRPWDLFTFAGDMSKAELLQVRNVNELATLKSMEQFVARLAKRYEDAGLGPALVDSGLLSAQGVVWFAKLALLRGEDPAQARNLRFAESLAAHPDKPSLTRRLGPDPRAPGHMAEPAAVLTATLGPVQLIVLGFNHPNFHREIIDALERLGEGDAIRVIDALAVHKDADGEIEVTPLSNLTLDEAVELGSKVAALIGLDIEGETGIGAGMEAGVGAGMEAGVEAGMEAGVEAGMEAGVEAGAQGVHDFSAQEAWDVLADIPNDSAAVLILLEHHWAVPLRNAIARAGGFRLSDGFISPLDLVAIGLLSAEEAKDLHAI
jgi:hypothetical protein